MTSYDDEGSYDEDLEDQYGSDIYGDDDETDLLPCPHCGHEIYEESIYCPVCHEAVTFTTHTWQQRPWWWIALGLAGILAVICVLVLAS